MAKKKSASPAAHIDDKVDFEKAIDEVEQIVMQLESGELGLTESLNQYELGIKRLKQCHGLLDAAEQRVAVLSGFDAEGNPITAPLDAESPSSSPSSARLRRKRPNSKSDNRDAAARRDPGEQDRVDDSPGLF